MVQRSILISSLSSLNFAIWTEISLMKFQSKKYGSRLVYHFEVHVLYVNIYHTYSITWKGCYF